MSSHDPKDELRERLTRFSHLVRMIRINWSGSDGGSRMEVKLLDMRGMIVDQWNDWMILGGPHNPSAKIIGDIAQEVLTEKSIAIVEVGTYFLTLDVRG